MVLSYGRGAIFTSISYQAAAPTEGKGKLPKLYEMPNHIAGVLQHMQCTVTLVKRYPNGLNPYIFISDFNSIAVRRLHQ